MNKQLVKWAALVGLCAYVFFSCSSTPTEVPTTTQEVGESAPSISEPAVQEPEVFTTVNFAQRLQKTLDEGTVEDALALFQELPPEYEDDLDMQLIYAVDLCFPAGVCRQTG